MPSGVVNIDGLYPVTPPASDSKKKPGVLTLDDLGTFEEVRFFDGFLSFDSYQFHLLLLQDALQEWVNRGQNEELFDLCDCNLAIINTRDDGQVPTYVEIGAAIVVQSKATKKYQIYDLINDNNPDNADGQWSYMLNTAISIIGLCRGTDGNDPV